MLTYIQPFVHISKQHFYNVTCSNVEICVKPCGDNRMLSIQIMKCVPRIQWVNPDGFSLRVSLSDNTYRHTHKIETYNTI